MAEFKISYKKTMSPEGGYSNDPDDFGKETYKGISRKFHPDWSGWRIIDGLRISDGFPRNLKNNESLEKLVEAFYKNEYWDKFKGDYIECQNIANELFDIGVNIGVGTSIKFLQKALNLLNRAQRNYPNIKIDGIFGGNTLKTLNSHPHNNKYIYNLLNLQQACHYINLANVTESQEKFIRGWLKRVDLE